jgi:hypothetical protein
MVYARPSEAMALEDMVPKRRVTIWKVSGRSQSAFFVSMSIVATERSSSV